MATSKSTVVGIRLDHERRAWVEAEAARRGVSVRGLFEGMIDGARTDEESDEAKSDAAGSEWTLESSGEPRDNGVNGGRATVDAPITSVDRASRAPSPGVNTPSSPIGPSLWPDFGSVTALPGGMIRGAISLTTGLVKTSSRCAFSRLESCPITRHWSGRSA